MKDWRYRFKILRIGLLVIKENGSGTALLLHILEINIFDVNRLHQNSLSISRLKETVIFTIVSTATTHMPNFVRWWTMTMRDNGAPIILLLPTLYSGMHSQLEKSKTQHQSSLTKLTSWNHGNPFLNSQQKTIWMKQPLTPSWGNLSRNWPAPPN